ncbi:MAG: MFS transporter [Defluviitaleaceae bacterium]|nr:MFS transporter [Defluviitaleaceae bacterium]
MIKSAPFKQKKEKLFTRNFSLLVIGQIISILGNMVLTFALPLYVLEISGSPRLFGLLLGLSNIPLLLFSPIGGIIADRLKKQKIMFWLDLITTIIIIVYIALSGFLTNIIPIIFVKLMALNSIQGMYMPVVQAAVPLLVKEDKLVSANSVTGIVNSFSMMAGMAIAGFMLDRFGITSILIISAICFAITAIMDLLIKIPYKKQKQTDSVAKMVKSDLTEATRFTLKDKPIIAKISLVLFFFILTFMAMIMVGMPILITQYLNMDMGYVGISQGIMMTGGIIGAIAAGALKMKVKKLWVVLMLSSLFGLPFGLIMLVEIHYFTAFIILTATSVISLAFATIGQILVMSYLQKIIPCELIGKVMAIVLMLPFLGQALGNSFYGTLFEAFNPYQVVFVGVILTIFVAVYTKVISKKIVE